jgi:hypothetical protein
MRILCLFARRPLAALTSHRSCIAPAWEEAHVIGALHVHGQLGPRVIYENSAKQRAEVSPATSAAPTSL